MTTRKSNILLVEDDEQIRRLLSTILEQSGYRVRRAHDGVAALEQLQSEVPDILLSDLHMPRMTGFELLPVVRQQFPMTSVVAMSSAFSGSEVPAGVAADAFYPKASNVAGLLEIIATVLSPPRIRTLGVTLYRLDNTRPDRSGRGEYCCPSC